MSDSIRRVLAWLPMAGVAALALRMAAVWDQLPPVMMSHFDAEGSPNGYMPRTVFLILSFVIVVFVVVLMAVMSERLARRSPSAGSALIALGWITDAFLISTFWSAITANLEHARLRIIPIWILFVLIVPLVLAISIDWRWWFSRERREAARRFSSARFITEQRHGSAKAALLFVLLAAGVALLASALPPIANSRSPFLLPVLGAVVALILLSALWAWRGFVYRFTTEGIEVRALGIRLRSIPLSQIKEFRAERVNPLTDFGGWGIKGFGNNTAYIWGGHKALHIQTNHGDVYLGHNDPDRLVRDLEAIITPARQGVTGP
jgi:hypothetical protein